MDENVYAIGDIHGEFDKLVRAFDWIIKDAKPREGPVTIVTLGDYVDRGPDSRKVLDFLIDAQRSVLEGNQVVCLAGNHELMMLLAMQGYKEWKDGWKRNGGDKTLAGYTVDPDPDRPGFHEPEVDMDAMQPHLDWIAQLPRIASNEHRIFVHAFLSPGRELDHPDQRDEMLWGRPPKHAVDEPRFKGIFGKQVVHGHTPQRGDPYVSEHRVNLDTGACFGGPLTVARWIGGEVLPHLQQF